MPRNEGAWIAVLAIPSLILLFSMVHRHYQKILDETESRAPVIIPELVERRWYHYLLHNHLATALKLILYAKGDVRIIVINVPWCLS